jgi:hypothetical protein
MSIEWVQPVPRFKVPRGKELPCWGQERFARYIAEGCKPIAAYHNAGFEHADARQVIRRCKCLLTVWPIRRRVEEWKVKLFNDSVEAADIRAKAEAVTTGELTAMLKRCFDVALTGVETPQVTAAVTAAMGLAKLHGKLVERHEVNVSQTLAVMSDADLDAFILELSAAPGRPGTLIEGRAIDDR